MSFFFEPEARSSVRTAALVRTSFTRGAVDIHSICRTAHAAMLTVCSSHHLVDGPFGFDAHARCKRLAPGQRRYSNAIVLTSQSPRRRFWPRGAHIAFWIGAMCFCLWSQILQGWQSLDHEFLFCSFVPQGEGPDVQLCASHGVKHLLD